MYELRYLLVVAMLGCSAAAAVTCDAAAFRPVTDVG